MNNLKTRFPEGMPMHHPVYGNGKVIGYFDNYFGHPAIVVEYFTLRDGEIYRQVISNVELTRVHRNRNRNRGRSRSGNRTRRRSRSRSGSGTRR